MYRSRLATTGEVRFEYIVAGVPRCDTHVDRRWRCHGFEARRPLSKIDFKHRRVVGGPSFEPHHKIIGCASHEPDLCTDNRSIFPDLLRKVKDLQELGQLPKRPSSEQVKDWASGQVALGEIEEDR